MITVPRPELMAHAFEYEDRDVLVHTRDALQDVEWTEPIMIALHDQRRTAHRLPAAR